MRISLLENSTEPGRVRARPWLLGAVTGALLVLVAVVYAYLVIFSDLRGHDEGYLMISVWGYLEGHPLYDAVFTQYGPFYYHYQWLLRSVAAVPLTHDATRLLCIAHWLSAAAVLALTGGILMRSIWGGLFVFMQAVVHLAPLANEPGHPQEVVALLLALGLLVTTVGLKLPGTMTVLGVVGAAVTLTKVNVGAFFCIASWMALHAHVTGRFQRRGWSAMVLAVAAMLPFLLMRNHLGELWFRNYSLTVAATVVGCFLASRAWACRDIAGLRPWVSFVTGFVLSAAAILAITLVQGSSLHGLFDGLIRTPMNLPNVGVLQRPTAPGVLPNAAIALAAGIGVILMGKTRNLSSLLLIFKGIFGIAGTLLLVGDAGRQLDYLLPWVWLVVAPGPRHAVASSELSFPRVFIAFSAAWQALQAYPVAGTQVAVGLSLMVIACTVSLADGIRGLAMLRPLQLRWQSLENKTGAALRWLFAVFLLFLFTNLWCKPHVLRERYARLKPMDLPGTHLLRLESDSVELYRDLMAYLRTSCDTFITYPGHNSFYFWTGQRPPTMWNSTGWGPLSEAQRQDILAALRLAERPLIVIHEYSLGSWANGVPAPLEPLVRFVRDECDPVQRFGPFVVFRLRKSGGE